MVDWNGFAGRLNTFDFTDRAVIWIFLATNLYVLFMVFSEHVDPAARDSAQFILEVLSWLLIFFLLWPLIRFTLIEGLRRARSWRVVV